MSQDYQNLASVGPSGNRREDLISQTDFDASNLVSLPQGNRREDLISQNDRDVSNLVSSPQGVPDLMKSIRADAAKGLSTIDRSRVSSTLLVRGGSSPAMRGTGRQMVVETAKKQKRRLLSEVKKVALHSVDEKASVSLASMPGGTASGKKKKLIDHDELEKLINHLEEDDDEDFEDLINVLFVLVVALALLCAGAFIFSKLEGLDCTKDPCTEKMPLIDGFYLAGMTLTTIGYGDFSPSNDASRVFMVLYSLLGLGVFSALIDVLGKWREKLPFEGDVTGAVVALLIVLSAGLALFSQVEGLEPSKALYLSFVTATTVGYGDFSPKTTEGKIGTVLYAMLSLSAMGYFCSFIGDGIRDLATALAKAVRGSPSKPEAKEKEE